MLRASTALTSLCLFALCSSAGAAAVSVTVTDTAGKPQSDVVVTIEPTGGARLVVKPMAGASVAQVKRQFVPALTVVTVGTPVSFPNNDSVRHHVYSFSPTKTFELKLYSGVPQAPVVFDKPGVAVVGCNIHDQMAAWIVVVDTPYHGITSASGELRLDNVPAGKYELRTWHKGLAAGHTSLSQPLTVATADATARIQLPVTQP
ncbi:MAG: hypothetical protein RLZZ618_333 [Pseudomonadota bacterium]|jgi:plastocyanin